MRRNTAQLPIREEDGPFNYTYLAVMAVPGIHLPEGVGDKVQFCAFPELNAETFLTLDWDAYCVHMDRSTAIAVLMLTGFCGRARFGKLSTYWNRLFVALFGGEKMFRHNLDKESNVVRETRYKDHESSGCYLVYKAEGDILEPVRLHATRKFGNIGFGIDAIQADLYRETHRTALHSTATALSLAMAETNGSPETHFIGDIIYLTGKNGLLVYCRSVQMGAVKIVMTSPPSSDSLRRATIYIPAMINDSRIETAISLFVQSQKRENDNLRAFIAAWSALELLVNRLSKVIRSEWENLVGEDILPKWDKDLKDVSVEDYRMRDHFFSVACVLDLQSARSDSEMFNRANDMRSGFYHRLDVQEKDLPTHDVRTLFRKYIKLGLSYQLGKHND